MGLSLSRSRIIYLIFYSFILFFSFWNRDFLQGTWETYTHFSTMAARDLSLVIGLSIRANIGGLGYASLEWARYLAEWMGHSFFVMRIPVILAGILAVISTERVLSRFFSDQLFRLGGVLLLFLNLYFQYFQHASIIVMISFSLAVCLTWLSYRLVEDFQVKNLIPFFAVAFFLSHYYSFGRYLFTLITLATVVTTSRQLEKKKAITHWGTFFLLFIVAQSLCGKISFARFYTPSEFFFPKEGSEIQHVQNSFLETMFLNLKLYLQAYFGIKGMLHVDNSQLIGTSLFVPFLPLLSTITMFVGLSLWVYRLVIEKEITYPKVIIAFWSGVGFILPLASKVFGEEIITFSPYRTFFSMFSAIFFILLALHRGEKHHKLIPRGGLLFLLLFQIHTVYGDYQRRVDFMASYQMASERNKMIENIRPNFKEWYKEYLSLYHQVWHYAKAFKKFSSQQESDRVRVFVLDISHFYQTYQHPEGLHTIKPYNYEWVLFGLSLGELGYYVNTLLFDSNHPRFLEINWRDFNTQKRHYPVSPYRRPEHIDLNNFRLVSSAPGKLDLRRDFIVLHHEELKVLEDVLQENNLAYVVIPFSHQFEDEI